MLAPRPPRSLLPPCRRLCRRGAPPPDHSAAGSNPRVLAVVAGKAGWIAGTTFLILIVPLIIEMDREQQLVEFESQQLNALTGSQQAPAK